ncbi:hypothetical protein [Kitasatospora cineracea]|uniref:Uncharacterized protein n=1 Tax=Kitasatospora cineracea TaxID=88074 RepID=A0A3N4RVB3_9ACTN|nr:hypothetical protein [Kitasatospora cineracea]RPE28014.1 hypothetical protein EDD38_7322 [Kitasatospora cineracea]
MSFSPGDNTVLEPMLFGAPTCEVCGGEMPERKGTGRRPKYCSKPCSSKADRQREKERRQALAEAAAAAESPRGETGAHTEDVLPPSDFPLDEQQAQLLEAAAELHRQTRIFLLQLDRAARNADPDLLRRAGADMRAAAYGLSARHRELVGHLLDQHPLVPPAPAGPVPASGVSPRGASADVERIAASVGAELLAATAPAGGGTRPADSGPAVPVESPRGETAAFGAGPEGAQGAWTPAVAPRGETHARPAGLAPSPAMPRGETTAASGADRMVPAQVDQRLAQQGSHARAAHAPATVSATAPAVETEPSAATVSVPRDPLLRGLPRDTDVSIPLEERTFGYNWQLAGWTVQPDVLVVLGEGYQVGWVERGLDGGDGWVAVYEGYFLGDAATQQAALHDTPEQAARIIHQAHVHNL